MKSSRQPGHPLSIPVTGRPSILRSVEVDVDDRGVPIQIDLDSEDARANPNHHLWRNGRLWWVAFTVHRHYRQERVRLSLGTDDLTEARARRDCILRMVAEAKDCEVSLRFSSKRRSSPTEREGIRASGGRLQ